MVVFSLRFLSRSLPKTRHGQNHARSKEKGPALNCPKGLWQVIKFTLRRLGHGFCLVPYCRNFVEEGLRDSPSVSLKDAKKCYCCVRSITIAVLAKEPWGNRRKTLVLRAPRQARDPSAGPELVEGRPRFARANFRRERATTRSESRPRPGRAFFRRLPQGS